MFWLRNCFAKAANIYDSLSPFYYTMKLFGLASFSLDFKSGQITVKIYEYLVFLCFTSLYILMIWTSFQTNEKWNHPGSMIVTRGWEYQYQLQTASTIVVVIFSFFKRKHFERFLKIISNFDKAIVSMQLKHNIKHTQFKFKLMFWLSISAITLIIISYSNAYTNLIMDFFNLYRMLAYVYMTGSYVVIVMQFICTCYCVAQRFEILNKNAL